jgi:hypothetical protein
VSRPPLLVVLVAVVLIALGETGGAALSQLRPSVERYAAARIGANRDAHGLTGSPEYDDEIRARATYAAEAGLSFFHTHAEGMGLVLFFTSTVVASVVQHHRRRRLLYLLLPAGSLVPLGYLAYGLAALEVGRDGGISLAERWVLSPLGTLAIAGLIGLGLELMGAVRRTGGTPAP